MSEQLFAQRLLEWQLRNPRPLPWKGEKDPWLVLLSEIILQQTRVEQGLPYFERFREKYPTVQSFAAAPEDEIMKMWEGLGYYARARNLHAAAKYISQELGGSFPDTHEGIRALKGVGDYTAAAVASFAFDLPHAVVDGNVYRVLSRHFGIEDPIDTTAGKKRFALLAQQLLEAALKLPSPGLPGQFNQAMMDFGATHCTPLSPKCQDCPMQPDCVAFRQGSVAALPVKSKTLERRQRYFNYFVFHCKEGVFVRKRTARDIWQDLYEFPLVESAELTDDFESLLETLLPDSRLRGLLRLRYAPPILKQELTHQRIIARFWEFDAGEGFQCPEKDWVWTSRENLKKFAYPRIFDLFFNQKDLSLLLF